MQNVLGRQWRSVKPLGGSIGNSAKLPLMHANAHQFTHGHVRQVSDKTAPDRTVGNHNGRILNICQPML
jgi:hypothetical protein